MKEVVMKKYSDKKQKSEPAPKTFAPSVITEAGKFLVVGLVKKEDKTYEEITYTVTIFDAHGKDEGPIDNGTMILRGSTVKANMFTKYGTFLLQHRRQIPAEYQKYAFIFPMGDKTNDEFVRLLNKKVGPDEWWCLLKYPAVNKWDNDCKLVRFTPDL
jgi:hypothetical protein